MKQILNIFLFPFRFILAIPTMIALRGIADIEAELDEAFGSKSRIPMRTDLTLVEYGDLLTKEREPNK